MIAITGASGRLGRSVAKALAQRGHAADVTLGTRNIQAIGEFAAQGFRTETADFDCPKTLQRTFAYADVALIICGTAPNEIRSLQHRHVIDAARTAGVRRIVYTSFVNPSRNSLFPFAISHAETENYLSELNGDYTVIRNNHYFDNLDGALRIALRTGDLSLPGASGKVAYLSLADIGAATAEVLLQSSDYRKVYEFTGAEALDLYEVAQRASTAWGRKVQASEMRAEQYGRILAGRGLPPYVVEAQIGIRLACGAGEYKRVTQDASELLQRKMATIDDYLRGLANAAPHVRSSA